MATPTAFGSVGPLDAKERRLTDSLVSHWTANSRGNI
jgi:hypothetical protein